MLRWTVFALLVLIWGSTWMAIKVGIAAYPVFFQIAVRFLVAAGIFLGLLRLRGEPLPLARRDQPFFLLLGITNFALSFGVVYWAEQYLTSGLAAVLFAVFPILVGVLAHVFLDGERLRWPRLLGLLLGFGGVAVIHSGDLAQIHPKAPLAAILFVLSPLSVSVANVLMKRRVHEFHAFALAGMSMLYAGLILGVVSALREGPAIAGLAWSWPGSLSLAYLTVVGSVVTFALYIGLMRTMKVGTLSLIAYFTPLVAVGLGTGIAGEPLTTQMLLGGLLIFAGIFVIGRAPTGSRA